MFSHFLRKLIPFAPAMPGCDPRTDSHGWHWQMAPQAGDVLDSTVLDVEGWITSGLAELVKENPARSVFRVTLPGGAVYVKRCRVWNVRAWAREVLRPAKARLEFENALQLAARGISTIQPLGWACRRPGFPGESLLLTREASGCLPFLDFAERFLPGNPSLRRTLAVELGRFLARMHEAGVAHPDPHPGNFLVSLARPGEPRFTLIDVHAIGFGPSLSWKDSRTNLVLFNRWFQLRVDRSDRLRFWKAYTDARPSLGNAANLADVERRTLASNLRFWAGREDRCLGGSRHFRKLRSSTHRGVAVRDLADSIVQTVLANPDDIFASGEAKLLKDSRTSTVAEWHVDGRVLILKRFRIRTRVERWKNLVRRSPALRSWVMGHTFADRWLPTPRPLMVLHRMHGRLPGEGYLLTEKVPDAIPLPEAAALLASKPFEEREPILREWSFQIATLLRRLHSHGVSHRDLKASNLLLEGAALNLQTAAPVFIDLVGVRTGRPLGDGRRARELARLNASFLNTPLVTSTRRLRFLKTYLQANLGKAGNWKMWWKAIATTTAAKIARNSRTGRPLT